MVSFNFLTLASDFKVFHSKPHFKWAFAQSHSGFRPKEPLELLMGTLDIAAPESIELTQLFEWDNETTACWSNKTSKSSNGGLVLVVFGSRRFQWKWSCCWVSEFPQTSCFSSMIPKASSNHLNLNIYPSRVESCRCFFLGGRELETINTRFGVLLGFKRLFVSSESL